MLLHSPTRARNRWLGLLTLVPALAVAQAHTPEPRWTGIDLSTVEDLSPPRADGFTSGFTADFKGGLVRVYILPSPTAASWWVSRMLLVVEKQKPSAVALLPTKRASHPPAASRPGTEAAREAALDLDAAHELYASGDSLVIARFDNVGLMVEARAGARDRAEAVLAALSDAPADWPSVPPLERTPRGWELIAAPDTVMRFEGGILASESVGLQFAVPPSMVVVYDAFGRASRQSFDTMGAAVDTPTPWAEHTLTERVPAAPESP